MIDGVGRAVRIVEDATAAKKVTRFSVSTCKSIKKLSNGLGENPATLLRVLENPNSIENINKIRRKKKEVLQDIF